MRKTLKRVNQCHKAISRYGTDDQQTNLINFLTDAMHWCDYTQEDLFFVLAMACHHYMNEIDPNKRRPR